MNAVANVIVWVFFAVGVIALAYVILQYVRHPAERDDSHHTASWR
jgi:hypothetical protein